MRRDYSDSPYWSTLFVQGRGHTPCKQTGRFQQQQHCIDVPSRPSNSVNLQKIEDLPAAKAEQFGHYFVDTIVAFCQQHSLSLDQFPKLILYQVRLDSDFGCLDLFACAVNRSTIQKWSIIFYCYRSLFLCHPPLPTPFFFLLGWEWGGQWGWREKVMSVYSVAIKTKLAWLYLCGPILVIVTLFQCHSVARKVQLSSSV